MRTKFRTTTNVHQRNALISSVILNQQSNQLSRWSPAQSPNKISYSQAQFAQKKLRKSSYITSSLQEEQIQRSKQLNPWSSVIGGRSRRYYKSKQFRQLETNGTNSVADAVSTGSPRDAVLSGRSATQRVPALQQKRIDLYRSYRNKMSTAPQSPPSSGGFYLG